MNVSALTQRLTPQMVTQAAARAVDNDGDGRTGAAALNDGDGAARAAAQQVVKRPTASPYKVDVKA